MYAQLKDLLEKNLPINLNQVEEQKALVKFILLN